ncbi:lanthionine synthetase C family protein [Kitasatospora sp. RB6PN24]|uniref:lanthionine synthetase C family protein n=1 Tax=Kitasatospora humi TaxID=2893891 RepID=UPI001E5DE379|nr:lanthionine synthetase C family protein [Kitasatospora humi]MCC9306486.1 lanthionine synthetase C family protein [Kitasatospora humi]
MSALDAIRGVTELLSAPEAFATGPQGPEHSLAAGRAGAAVALALLADGADGADLRRAAHGHLAAAVKSPGAMRGGGLYSGVAALAYAARTMARQPGEYRTLLDGLAPRVREAAAGRGAALREELAAGAGLRMHTFDVVSGATGLGRLLLALEPDGPALAELIGSLAELAKPSSENGAERGGGLPRWWTAGGPGLPGADPAYPRGHLNLGLAHGVPGPLALLALARLQGVQVPGQDTAIEALASWLVARRVDGRWPMTLRVEDEEAGRLPADPPTRAAWCYGTPGVARALFLAGAALGRADWRGTAVAALVDTLRDPSTWHLQGVGLCHGTGGLLRITQRMAEDSGSTELAGRLPGLADAVTRQLDAALGADEPPGLLEGTAGAALALHAHANPSAGPPTWDAFLLLN